MTDIAPGELVLANPEWQWVPPAPNGEQDPTAGMIYTVREVVRVNNEAGIRLWEIKNDPQLYPEGLIECAFRIEYFTPLRHNLEDTEIETEEAV